MPWEKQFDREAVLDRVMQLFWSRGYEATSMQDIVESTSVNRGSLYATYGDKHALYLAALRMYDERMRRDMLAELEANFEPREAIRRLFLKFTEQASPDGSNRGCFMTNTALELAAHDREARQIVANAQEQIQAFLERMIATSQAQGTIGGHANARDVARGLLASLIGLLVLIRSRPDPALLQAIVDDAIGRLG
ncbi:MAG: TetR/AcrR family transcriptional regulator [Alphaproteobacteria bacterium]